MSWTSQGVLAIALYAARQKRKAKQIITQTADLKLVASHERMNWWKCFGGLQRLLSLSNESTTMNCPRFTPKTSTRTKQNDRKSEAARV
jgi:hypothetical protein